ncbi:hypothetical protein [uncultured Cedecea sp.]|uniref:hypothetical protein n=1 Tax=uncultured Cedecea sp. TaxID=988762 RepID=UPI00260DFD1B|nr:hypothetical protein [uncultured Cedecea sp.]
MITAYINGSDLGWLLTLVLLFDCVCGLIALAMLVIPKRYDLYFHRGYIFVITAFSAIAGVVAFLVLSLKTFTPDELEVGRHWQNDCTLLAVSIPEGTYTAPVNQLDCADIIIHVPTQTFNLYTAQWEMYQAINK